MKGCLAIASSKLEASSVRTHEGSSFDSLSPSALTKQEIDEKTKRARKIEEIQTLDSAAIRVAIELNWNAGVVSDSFGEVVSAVI